MRAYISVILSHTGVAMSQRRGVADVMRFVDGTTHVLAHVLARRGGRREHGRPQEDKTMAQDLSPHLAALRDVIRLGTRVLLRVVVRRRRGGVGDGRVAQQVGRVLGVVPVEVRGLEQELELVERRADACDLDLERLVAVGAREVAKRVFIGANEESRLIVGRRDLVVVAQRHRDHARLGDVVQRVRNLGEVLHQLGGSGATDHRAPPGRQRPKTRTTNGDDDNKEPMRDREGSCITPRGGGGATAARQTSRLPRWRDRRWAPKPPTPSATGA